MSKKDEQLCSECRAASAERDFERLPGVKFAVVVKTPDGLRVQTRHLHRPN